LRNINGLRAFRAVVITRSMTQAGARLGLTQSAVSRLIAALEAELGFALFTRQGGRILITAEGEAFYAEVEQVLAGLDDLERVGRNILAGHGRQLRVFAMSPFVNDLLPMAFKAFRHKFPTVRTSLDIRGGREFIYWDVGRRFDLGMALLPGDRVAASTRVFAKVPAIAVLPKGHRLAGARRVSLTELAQEDLVLLQPTSLIRRWIDGKFAELRRTPNVLVETSSLYVCCQYAARGLGATIADPLSAHALRGEELVARPLEGNLQMSCAFVLRGESEPSAVARAFMDIVQDEAGKLIAGMPQS
jgi:DNA-binding transcriptional LysR family regulator